MFITLLSPCINIYIYYYTHKEKDFPLGYSASVKNLGKQQQLGTRWPILIKQVNHCTTFLTLKKTDTVLQIVLVASVDRDKILHFCNRRDTRNMEKLQALMFASMQNIALFSNKGRNKLFFSLRKYRFLIITYIQYIISHIIIFIRGHYELKTNWKSFAINLFSTVLSCPLSPLSVSFAEQKGRTPGVKPF